MLFELYVLGPNVEIFTLQHREINKHSCKTNVFIKNGSWFRTRHSLMDALEKLQEQDKSTRSRDISDH